MHLTLTDRLTCPRCGPAAGLIVLMDEVADRRVVSGSLGCPLCRTRYPIADRVADLRVDPGAGAGPDGGADAARLAEAAAGGAIAGGESSEAAALRVAALMGLTEGSGFIVLDGPGGLDAARGIGALAPDYEAVVPVAPEQAGVASRAAVSALLVDASLPMADSLMRGAAWVGGVPDDARLRELVRVVRPTGRVVVDAADGDAAGLDEAANLLVELGAQVRARDATGLVAVVM